MSSKFRFIFTITIFSWLTLQACTCGKTTESIKIDGSSTVYVISEAIAEEFNMQQLGKVSISVCGTGGGFKKLCSNRANIIGASRQITASERELCQKNSVDFVELPVAYDGIVVAVNPANTWINKITVSTLKRMFEPAAEGKMLKWSDVDPSWPNRKFEIFAPGISSGTYDYFTKAIIQKEHSSRGDMTTSEDDNVLVHGILSTIDSIGFFSFAYFRENKDRLKALAIINDVMHENSQPVMPTIESIRSGEYSPLSRPVYLYANKAINDVHKKFIRFYVETSSKIAQDVGFVPLNNRILMRTLASIRDY